MGDKDQKRKKGCLYAALAPIGLVFVIAIFSMGDDSGSTSNYSPPVESSPIDGSVRQVKDWLEDNLKDPDSVEYIEWSPVFEPESVDAEYGVRVKYRARNSLGGFVIEEKLFFMDSTGNVVSQRDYSP